MTPEKRRRRSRGVRTGTPGEAEILDALSTASAPLKTKELARRLGVGSHRYRDFRDRLRDLVKRGRILRLKGNRFAPVSEDRQRLRGIVELVRSGDAFLARRDGPDVFVSSRDLAGALDGDEVVVEAESEARGRRPTGVVVEIVRRGAKPVVGVFNRSRTRAEVVSRRGPALTIPPEQVGEARSGDVVEAEVLSSPTPRRGPLGRIVRVIGRAEDPRVEATALRAEHQLDAAFPPDVIAAAEARAALQVTLDPGRVDRRELHTVVIDPEDARDHDDAVSVTRREDGSLEIGIHIADVSFYVPAGSALDLEAYRRGTSVYLVDGVVPMLPEALSGGACSLSEGSDRRALSLFVPMSPDGTFGKSSLERTLIRCDQSLDYQAAQAIIEGGAAPSEETRWTLETLHEVAKILRKRREDRGSLDLDLPEARVEVDAEGTPTRILRRERFDSHRLIEELMVLANELVAVESLRRGWPVLYRAHDPPDPDRIEELAMLVAMYGYELRASAGPADLSALLDRSRGAADEAVVHSAVLRSLKKAEYAADRTEHFGLASRAYTHFTSPIRRYPDLHLHRVLTTAWLERGTPSPLCAGEDLAEAAGQLSYAERRADAAQRDSIDLARVQVMASRLGDVFSGRISSIQPFGFFVRLDDLFVDGLVHVASLTDDFYELHRGTATLIGANTGRVFRIGDAVRVQVARVDRAERRIDFALLSVEDDRSTSARPFDTSHGPSYPLSDHPTMRPQGR